AAVSAVLGMGTWCLESPRRLNGTRSWNLPDGRRGHPGLRGQQHLGGRGRPYRRLDPDGCRTAEHPVRDAVLAVVGGPGLLVSAPNVHRRRSSGRAGGATVLTVDETAFWPSRCLCRYTAIGSSATNLDPPEPLDSTQMRPPIRSSNSRLM